MTKTRAPVSGDGWIFAVRGTQGVFPLFLGLLLLGSCVTAPPAPTEAQGEPELFELFGVPAHHTPVSEADEELAAIWSELEAFLASSLLDPGEEIVDDPGALAGALQVHTQRVQNLDRRLEILASRGDDDRIFAALAKGAIFEHLAADIRAIPCPSIIASRPEMEVMFREALDEQAGAIDQVARAAYELCAGEAEDERAGVCSQRASGLGPSDPAAIRRPPFRRPPERQIRPATGPLPEGCGSRSSPLHFAAQPVPAPAYWAEPVIALTARGLPLDDATTEALIASAMVSLGAHTEIEILPREAVRRAEALVESRRLSEDGPVCGQAPPLEAVLAQTYPHLMMAWLETVHLVEAAAPQGEAWAGAGRAARLELRFVRVGAAGDDVEGIVPVPELLTARVEDRDDPTSWLEAASSLASQPREGGLVGVYGGLGMLEPAYVHVAEAEGTDPWLRIGRTLAGERREDLLACYGGPGVASFDLRWLISPEGSTAEAEVELHAVPPVFGEAEGMDEILDASAACLREVILATGWPCPLGGAPVEARARVCLGLAD